MRITRRTWIGAAAATAFGAAAFSVLRRRRPTWKPEAIFSIRGEKRTVVSNGIPDHAIGDFPNPHDPVPLRPQNHRLEMPAHPQAADRTTPLSLWLFGVAVNGVPFDPSGPFWNSDADSGWQFEALHPAAAVALGIDVNHAHTQGRGMYHYHGLPTSLLADRTAASPQSPMQLLGYAADGFPIYGPECPGDSAVLASRTKRLRSSYRLRSGRRKDGPRGRFDGAFVEDYEYVPQHGDLDECNGRSGPTPEFPDGVYYYVLTDDFPFIPRLYRGRPDASFRHGPPPGVSPPLPPELKCYVSRD